MLDWNYWTWFILWKVLDIVLGLAFSVGVSFGLMILYKKFNWEEDEKLRDILFQKPLLDVHNLVAKSKAPASASDGRIAITLIKGTDLVAKDAGKSSDPYVIFKIGKETLAKSTIIQKTLHPIWNETFYFKYSDWPENEFLMMEVWDEDALGDDYMGACKIARPKYGLEAKVLQLANLKKGKHRVSGSLKLKIYDELVAEHEIMEMALKKHSLSNKPKEFTAEELELLKNGGEREEIKEGRVILEAASNSDSANSTTTSSSNNSTSRSLHLIHSGKVQILLRGAQKTIATLSAGELFGEETFLLSQHFGSVVAASDCVIYTIPISFLVDKVQHDPEFAFNFYHVISNSLAAKLRTLNGILAGLSRDSDAATKQPIDKKGVMMSSKEYTHEFKLPEEEELLHTFQCKLTGLLQKSGFLYASTTYLCFSSKVFSHTTKIRLHLGEIQPTAVDISNCPCLVIKSPKKSYCFAFKSEKQSKKAERAINAIKKEIARNAGESSLQDHDEEGEEQWFTITENDWATLIQNEDGVTSEATAYDKEDVILREGGVSSVCQISSGTCRVEKVFDQTHLRVLATLKTSEIFGEMGFMSGLPAGASIVSNNHHTEIYSINPSRIEGLWEKNKGLVVRFYHYNSTVIANRIRSTSNNILGKISSNKENEE